MERPIRLAVIGYGSAGRSFSRAANYAEGWELAAVSGRNMERAKNLADTLSVGTCTVDELAARDDVDVVAITTPPGVHADDAIKMAQAKKHLIVEKPFALNLEDCDAMIKAAEENTVELMVSHTHRFYPNTVTFKQMIDSGKFGKPVMIQDRFLHNYFTEKRSGWQLDPKLSGGGVVMNPVCHFVDRLRYYAGGTPLSISATIGYHKPGFDIEGNAHVFMRFDNEISASLTLDGYGGDTALQTLVVCSEACLYFDFFKPEIVISWDRDKKETVPVEGFQLRQEHQVNEGYVAHLDVFRDCLVNNTPMKSPGENGRETVRCLLALFESARTGREVNLCEFAK